MNDTDCCRLNSFFLHFLVEVEIGKAQGDKEVSEGDRELIDWRHVVDLDWRGNIVYSINHF